MTGPGLPVLYLMCPMTLYGSAEVARAREFPFGDLAGFPVAVECAEGMFPDTRSWAAAWPSLRHRYAAGVFLDHLGGWVSRGVWAEACDLHSLGVPVWWFRSGDPVRRFGFGPGDNRDWAGRYRAVYALPGHGEGAGR